ncbi:MAG TPA: putative zinc-binding protein [Bacteroidales bacterium]|nr:putative zinc-binding protein [Bacteroidales bacterium]
MSSIHNQKNCLCNSGEYVVITCSGACDLGQISDLVARKLRDNKIRKMNCLAAVAADVKPTIEMFQEADLLLIDGCAVDCGKKILDKAGITNYKYMRITDLGYVKGQTPVTSKVIEAVYEKAAVDY